MAAALSDINADPEKPSLASTEWETLEEEAYDVSDEEAEIVGELTASLEEEASEEEDDDDNPYQNSDEALPDDDEEAALRNDFDRDGEPDR